MYSLQDEWNRYNGTYGGSVGYGGSQAGTGTGGVDGVGPIHLYGDGSVLTGNYESTQTLPDGTRVTTTVQNGVRHQVIVSPNGTLRTVEDLPPDLDEDGAVISVAGVRETIEYPDGTKVNHVQKEDGWVAMEIRRPDGSLERLRKFPDGKVEFRTESSDGIVTSRTKYPDGRLDETRIENGVEETKIKYADGTVEAIKIENGLEEHRIVYADGTVKSIKKQNGLEETVIRCTDGTVKEIKKDQHEEEILITYADGATEKITNSDGYYYSIIKFPTGVTLTEMTTRSLDPRTGNLEVFHRERALDQDGELRVKEITIVQSYIANGVFLYIVKEQEIRDEFDSSVNPPATQHWILEVDTNPSENNSQPRLDFPSFNHLRPRIIDAIIENVSESLPKSQQDIVLKASIGSEVYYLNVHIGSDSDDQLSGDGLLSGKNGNDSLAGGMGADVLEGGTGNDILSGRGSGDRLDGGDGLDIASYETAESGVSANIADALQNTGDAVGDIYVSIEGLRGSAFNDRLIGSDGNDVLDAGRGNDTLSSGSGNDSLYGGDGDDVLNAGIGADRLDGGTGSDWVSYAGSMLGVTVSLADGRGYAGIHGGMEAAGDTYFNVENVEGGNGIDVLTGNATANHLKGLGSDDILQGGGGADTLDGGVGFNWASYSAATTGVTANLSSPSQNTGEAAGDVYIGIHGLQGSLHSDVLIGNAGNNVLSGLAGDDILEGGAGGDRLEGGAGFNWASYAHATSGVIASLKASGQNTGEAAGDVYVDIHGLQGSAYSDKLEGRDGGTSLSGLAGNDTLIGGNGLDNLDGGVGDDVLQGGAGADRLDGGIGLDWVSYAGSTSGVHVSLADGRGYTGLHGGTDANGDVYSSIENVEGGNGVDVLTGDRWNNQLRGLGSDDILEGGAGADTLDGGSGFNWASYSTATTGVTANLGASSQNTGDAAGDVYISMHGLQGSHHGDRLVGDAGGNALSGLSGNDTLDGGAGADILEGGAGDDQFVFSTALGGGNVDRVADFNVWEDRIVLDTRIFKGVFGYLGAVYSELFKVGTGATDWDDRIIYNSTSGELFYDADGIGAGAQVKFAELSKGLALSADSFRVLY